MNNTWKKTGLLILVGLILAACALPASAGRHDYAKTRQLERMAGPAENGGTETPTPGENAPPLPPQPPEGPVVDNPVPADGVQVYCAIPQDRAANLEALCQKHKIGMRLYWNYRSLVFLKRVSVIVVAPKKNTALLSELYKRYNGRKIGKVEVRANIAVHSAYYGVKAAKEFVKVATFDELDGLIAPIVKEPYGPRSKMFHVFAEQSNALAVVAREWAGLGREHKFLFNPSVEITMTGIDMDGKGHNVTMFNERYEYQTIQRNKDYVWKP